MYIKNTPAHTAVSTDLSRQLVNLKESTGWMMAHGKTGWLSTLLDVSLQSSPAAVEVMKLLGEGIPDWMACADWEDSDSKSAQALNHVARGPTSCSQKLEGVTLLLMAGLDTRPSLRFEVYGLFCAFSRELAQQLRDLQLEGRFCEARKETQWLSVLLDTSVAISGGRQEVMQVLEGASSWTGWRAFAIWQPDMHRLSMHERLNAEQRRSLGALLALEGPDFGGSQQANMREALIAENSACSFPVIGLGRIRIMVRNKVVGHLRDKLERLSNAVTAACKASRHEINLLIYLCCSGRFIGDNTLNILEAICLMGNPQVSTDTLIVLKPARGVRGRRLHMTAIMRLLPALGQSSWRALREALSLYLARLVSACMRETQAKPSIQLGNSNLVGELHAFGLSVKAAGWLHPFLDNSLWTLITTWPSTETILLMDTLRSDFEQWAHGGGIHPLREQLNEYCTELLTEPNSIDLDTSSLFEALTQLWQQKPDYDRRSLAFRIAQDRDTSMHIRVECLRQLPTVPNRSICDLNEMFHLSMNKPSPTCVKVVQNFAALVHLEYERTVCWRSVLYDWIQDQDSTLFEYSLTHLTADHLLQWLLDLRTIFMDMVWQGSHNSPYLLQPALHERTHRTCRYWAIISRREGGIGSGSAIQSLLLGSKGDYCESILQILELLEYHYQEDSDGDKPFQPEVAATIALLNRTDDGNAKDICLALAMLKHTSLDGNNAYLRVLEVSQHASREVVHLFLVGWLRYPELCIVDRRALKALKKVLRIHLDDDDHPAMNALDAASGYINSQVTSLLAEANNLAGLQRSLKAMDPEGISALLAELGIEDTSLLEYEIAHLPPELFDVVEMVAEDVVELHFPLTHHSALIKAGMGTSSSQSLIVCLAVENSSLVSRFCMHLGDESKGLSSVNGHSPRLILEDSRDRGTSSCHSCVNRATFQLGYILSRHLLEGSKTIEETYKLLKVSLDTLTQNCIVCGTSLGIRLRRSAVCGNTSCSATFLYHANLDIQLCNLQEDIQVGDLLLTAVQAAVTSGNKAILLECPVGGAATITELLNRVAKMMALEVSASNDLQTVLWRSGKEAVDLLKWIFNYYNGFLVSASGQMRIPSMPGIHQFLLANAAPNLEAAFAAQVGAPPTRVVFHGTSLDRLYSILCQGLRVCSGNSALQRHGACYGNGIYVADEPTTAKGYAHICSSPARGTGWHSSTFRMASVLLGCEASGNIPSISVSGVYLVPNPNMLILRYIFIVPDGIRVPLARHIVPAMASVFASLRSGSL